MTRHRILPLVALTLVLSTTITESASAGARHARLAIPLPTAGHVTVAAVDLTVRGAKLPRRVRLGAPGARKLPPAVKVLWATRSRRVRGGRRYAGLVFVIRKADARASARAAGGEEPNIIDLIFRAAPGGCVDCRMTETVSVRDLDLFKQDPAPLDDLFRRDWGDRGAPESIFGGGGHRPDPTLDTGHYDDGHSFGWGTPKRQALPPRDVIRVEIDLVRDLGLGDPPRLVTDLEVATAVDLNGDGAVGAPRQQIDTRVGPITVS